MNWHALKKRKHSGPKAKGKANTKPKRAMDETAPVNPLYPISYRKPIIGGDKFLTPDHPQFEEVLSQSYKGLIVEPSSQIPPEFHDKYSKAFKRLFKSGLFQYDVVQAGGSKLSRTFVKRTLIGQPGITYKYLGLRIFAHSWDQEEFRDIKELNDAMTARSESFRTGPGSSYFNLTLINFMEPSSCTRLGLKSELEYGMGLTSVSWHADSCLQDYSTIGVYNQIEKKSTWRIAVRVSPECNDTTTPPLVHSISTGDAYHLVGDFNHHHQHAVLSGPAARYSSTHRVAVTEGNTLAGIRDKVLEALNPPDGIAYPEQVMLEQVALNEVEFEWIRQYWSQGIEHNNRRPDWQTPMKKLEKAWGALEKRTLIAFERIMSELNELAPLLLAAMQTRQRLREEWKIRVNDRVFAKRIAPEFQPVVRPVFNDESPLPYDLDNYIVQLRHLITLANNPVPFLATTGNNKRFGKKINK